ncbi:hypothetical protein JHS3_25570 [Jeongeupia sp. HS-3]|nr:hypothetical protein JHS3_25570 [Jeongeupia sp. HS-3]
MVGITLGLLSTLVVMQTLTASEGQKRTTASGSNAQSNGALALYMIKRDAKMAGYGFAATTGALGCEMKMMIDGSSTPASLTLNPVTITNGVNGAPDQLRFLGSAKDAWSLPMKITVDHPVSAAQFFVDSDLGVHQGDLMVAVPALPSAGKWCTLFQATKEAASGSGGGGGQGQNQVQHNPSAIWNPPGGNNGDLYPAGGYSKDDHLINLGTLVNKVYVINNQTLQLTSFNSSDGSSATADLYPQIIDLQAQYGSDDGSNGGTADDGVIDGYGTTTPSNSTGWKRVLALRVAVLSRSTQWEKEEATPAAPKWSGGDFVMGTGSDWKHYRYKAYESVAPLRNVIWQQ